MTSKAKTGSKKAAPPTSTLLHKLKTTVSALLIAIGCLTFSAYVVVHWVERQILSPDNWVALVSPLPKQEVVSTALGSYISDQIFSNTPVKEKITEALPEKAAFLAGPLTNQLQSLTTKLAQNIVSSDVFQSVWVAANRIAITRLVESARNPQPAVKSKLNEKFDLNISAVTAQIRQVLGNASDAIPSLQPDTNKNIDITTDLRSRPQTVRSTIRTTDYLAAIMPFLIAACFLGALALVDRRRRTAQVAVVTIFVLMLLELIGIKYLKSMTLDQVRIASNLGAVGYIYDTLVAWLKQMIYVVLIGSVIAFVLLLLGGPAKWAQKVRSFIRIDYIKTSTVGIWWRNARQWIKKWEYYLWLGSAVLVIGIVALFGKVNSQTVTNALLIMLSLIAIVHILATPKKSVESTLTKK